MTNTREQGICQQVAWQTDPLMRFCTAFLQVVVTGWLAGVRVFATDDVPEYLQPEVPNIAGNACHILTAAHVLRPVMVGDTGQIYRRRSTRKTAKDRWVNCYTLISLPMAREWLARHGVELPEQQEQKELALL